MKMQIKVSHQERKSRRFLEEAFDVTYEELYVGDVVTPTTITELKIDADVTDRARLQDECSRMNEEPYNTMDRHCLFITTQTYCQTMGVVPVLEQYKTMVGICLNAGIRPHHVYGEEEAIAKLKKIMSGYYQTPHQYHARPTHQLSFFAKILALRHGVTELEAIHFADQFQTPYALSMLIHTTPDHFFRTWGLNQDGSVKRVAAELAAAWNDYEVCIYCDHFHKDECVDEQYMKKSKIYQCKKRDRFVHRLHQDYNTADNPDPDIAQIPDPTSE